MGQVTINQPSIMCAGGGLGVMSGQIGIASGLAYLASGGIVGQTNNLNNSDTFCNMGVIAQPLFGSGQLRIAVQCSDQDVSGNYFDPTSGLAQFPAPFQSGGIIWINSGGLGSGTIAGGVSGQNLQSGLWDYFGFQRTGTFVRAVALSGDFFAGVLTVGFVSQFRTTGSGGGFTLNPSSSGQPNVFV